MRDVDAEEKEFAPSRYFGGVRETGGPMKDSDPPRVDDQGLVTLTTPLWAEALPFVSTALTAK
jgi:hypothetical protein